MTFNLTIASSLLLFICTGASAGTVHLDSSNLQSLEVLVENIDSDAKEFSGYMRATQTLIVKTRDGKSFNFSKQIHNDEESEVESLAGQLEKIKVGHLYAEHIVLVEPRNIPDLWNSESEGGADQCWVEKSVYWVPPSWGHGRHEGSWQHSDRTVCHEWYLNKLTLARPGHHVSGRSTSAHYRSAAYLIADSRGNILSYEIVKEYLPGQAPADVCQGENDSCVIVAPDSQ